MKRKELTKTCYCDFKLKKTFWSAWLYKHILVLQWLTLHAGDET